MIAASASHPMQTLSSIGPRRIALAAVALVVAVAAWRSVFVLSDGELGVVLRFGRPVHTGRPFRSGLPAVVNVKVDEHAGATTTRYADYST